MNVDLAGNKNVAQTPMLMCQLGPRRLAAIVFIGTYWLHRGRAGGPILPEWFIINLL